MDGQSYSFDKMSLLRSRATKEEANSFAREVVGAIRTRAEAESSTADNSWYQFWFTETELSRMQPGVATHLKVPIGGLVQLEVLDDRKINHVEIASYRGDEITPADDNEALAATKVVFQRGTHAFFIKDKPAPPLTVFQLEACKTLARMAIDLKFFDAPK